MKGFALLCAVFASQGAFASFELALILQNYEPLNGQEHLNVTRWDPLNRLSLGQFSVVDNSISSKLSFLTTAPGTVDLLQLQDGTLRSRRYNYSTGIYVDDFNTGVSMITLNSATFVNTSNILASGNFGGNHQARIYNQAGGLVRAYTMPASTLQAVDAIMTASGVTYALSRQAGTVSGSKYTLTSYASGSGAIFNSVVVADNTTVTAHSLTAYGNHIAIGSSLFSNREVFLVNGATIGAAVPTGGYIQPTATLANGHGEFIYGFGIDTVNTLMSFTTGRITTNGGGTYWTTSATRYGTIYDSAIVLAPEPGTFVAIGVGVAALLRRRRSK